MPYSTSPRCLSGNHPPDELRNVPVRPFATTTPEEMRVDAPRRSVAVYVPSSLITKVTLPMAALPPESARIGPKDPLHVPTRSAGRADGRTSDSVSRATALVRRGAAHPQSTTDAMVAT